jgi:hypothetical protein
VRTVTSSTAPQDRAVAALVVKFKAGYDKSRFYADDLRGYSSLVVEQEEDGPSMRPLTFGEIVDCLADAGFLSGTQGEGDGSLRSEPPATGQVQWAVLRDDEDYVYDDESMALTVLATLLEDDEDSYSLYEIREVSP